MGKLDALMKASAGIASESMGRPPAAPTMSRASAPDPAGPDRFQGVVRSKAAAEVPLTKIAPDPDQPREDFDREALDRLAGSLKGRGQLQPIRVRWDEGRGLYVIVCGERRWRAAGMAGMTAMSCVIMEGPVSPGELLTIQVVENALREDLKPVEQARAFRSLMDLNGWSTHQAARELAVDQSSVVRSLALLDLPAAVQAQVEQGTLTPSAAYEVSKLDDPGVQADLATRVVTEGLSRAETVEAVRRTAGRAGKPKGRGAGRAKRATSRVFRKLAGYTVTVENGRGVEPGGIAEALELALASVRAEIGERDQAAA